MTKKIAVANQKGGVGKTHICLHLGGVLSELGKKVLLIDMDPQGNLSEVFIEDIYSLEQTVAELLLNGNTPASEVIQTTDIERLDILPANLRLADLDAKLAADPDSQYLLADILEAIPKDQYDFVLIDCPRSLGRATRMALVAADAFLVPIQPQKWATSGLRQLLGFVQMIKKRANPNLELLGILISLMKHRKVEKDYVAQVREAYSDKVFEAEIHDYVEYVHAIEARKPIHKYREKSDEAETYRQLAQEIIKRTYG